MQTDRNFLSNYQGIGPCVCGAFHHSAYAVHNETSKAVEQLICDDRFRTRYGCSANPFCRPARLRAITFEPTGTTPQTWLLTNVV